MDEGLSNARILEVSAWFQREGWGPVVLSESEGYYWASLTQRDGSVAVPQYGRGLTADEAAESARRRYQHEELGVDE
jgi:predicted NUDIX family NTP pyrophosphohydrolase